MVDVFIADDHTMFRDGIKQALENAQDIRVVGEAERGPDLFSKLERSKAVDILLLDIRMPDFNVFHAVPRITAEYPNIQIVILTGFPDYAYMHRLPMIGIRGFVLKDETLEQIVRTVRIVASGGTYYNPEVEAVILGEKRDGLRFSPRENEVMYRVAKGMTSAEIGVELHISRKTVDTHIERVGVKLGTRGRPATLHEAGRLGLIWELGDDGNNGA